MDTALDLKTCNNSSRTLLYFRNIHTHSYIFDTRVFKFINTYSAYTQNHTPLRTSM